MRLRLCGKAKILFETAGRKWSRMFRSKAYPALFAKGAHPASMLTTPLLWGIRRLQGKTGDVDLHHHFSHPGRTGMSQRAVEVPWKEDRIMAW